MQPRQSCFFTAFLNSLQSCVASATVSVSTSTFLACACGRPKRYLLHVQVPATAAQSSDLQWVPHTPRTPILTDESQGCYTTAHLRQAAPAKCPVNPIDELNVSPNHCLSMPANHNCVTPKTWTHPAMYLHSLQPSITKQCLLSTATQTCAIHR